jgi:hypothetical protein
MSEKTDPKPVDPDTAAGHEEPAEKKPEDEKFHPSKHHEHMVIHAPQTGVAHVDPGAVVFP